MSKAVIECKLSILWASIIVESTGIKLSKSLYVYHSLPVTSIFIEYVDEDISGKHWADSQNWAVCGTHHSGAHGTQTCNCKQLQHYKYNKFIETEDDVAYIEIDFH